MKDPVSRLDRAYRLFFEAVRTNGVDAIIQAAYQLFEHPVLFVDQYFRVANLYPNLPIGNPAWDAIVAEKTVNRDRVMSVLDEFLSGEEPFYRPFYANTGSCTQQPCIFAEVVRDKQVLGHVIISMGQRPAQDEDFAIVQLMLDAICIKIESRQQGLSTWHLSLNTKFRDLLDEQTPPHLFQLAKEVVSSEVAGDYAVLVTPIGQRASQRAFAEYSITQLQQMYRNIISVVYDDSIVTLIGEIKFHGRERYLRPETNSFVQKLFDYFKRHDMMSGLSNRFSDIGQIYPCYRQAKVTAQLAVTINYDKPAVFLDFMPLPIFISCLKQEDSSVFIHPLIRQIQDYDKANNTEYYNTLRAYSFSMHNKDRTAARLNIHRNTLLYRLNRIADLFDLPYEDERTSLNLLCSFLLLECEPGSRNDSASLLYEMNSNNTPGL